MGSGQQRWLSALAVRNVTDSNPLRSFRERNVRIFFGGLWISTIGTWAHNIAMVLLVRELGGTGLGLSIVKHVTQLHGGTARVESTLGQGASFHLTFPTPQTPETAESQTSG